MSIIHHRYNQRQLYRFRHYYKIPRNKSQISCEYKLEEGGKRVESLSRLLCPVRTSRTKVKYSWTILSGPWTWVQADALMPCELSACLCLIAMFISCTQLPLKKKRCVCYSYNIYSCSCYKSLTAPGTTCNWMIYSPNTHHRNSASFKCSYSCYGNRDSVRYMAMTDWHQKLQFWKQTTLMFETIAQCVVFSLL